MSGPFSGHNTTISFTGVTGTVTKISHDGMKAAPQDTTHLTTNTGRTFIPGLVDPGTLKVEGFFNAEVDPPIDGNAETFTITFPDSTVWNYYGFLTDAPSALELEKPGTSSFTIKLSGKPVKNGV